MGANSPLMIVGYLMVAAALIGLGSVLLGSVAGTPFVLSCIGALVVVVLSVLLVVRERRRG